MAKVGEALRSTGRVSAVVLGSRVLGLVREVVFAALFGAGAVADAFAVAFRIPNVLRDLLAEGALSSAFVPTFTAALHNDSEPRAHHLGNLVMSLLLVITGTLTAAGMIWNEQVVLMFASGFAEDPHKLALAARLTRIMMPILSLVTLGAVWMGMLNARRHFIVPAVAPAIFNVVSLLGGAVVWWLRSSVEDGIVVWAVGTLLAGVAQAGTQLPALWRLGYRPWIRLRGVLADPGVRRVARLMAPATVGLAAVQLNIIVNTHFASEVGDGALAQLSYAFRLFFLPLGVFGVALATVTTTDVSEEAARGDRAALAQRVADSASAGWMLTSASAVGLVVLAVPVTTLVYAHGETSSEAAAQIGFILQAYVIGLVPYALVKIFAPAFYSIDRPRIPLLASATAVAVNITFNALTFRQLGAPGIALGTALGAMANIAVLRIAFARVVGPMPVERRLRRLLALLLANLAMGAAVAGAWWCVVRFAGTAVVPAYIAAPALLVVIAIGFFVYTSILRAFGYPSAQMLAGLPAAIWRKIRRR